MSVFTLNTEAWSLEATGLRNVYVRDAVI